MCQAHNLCWAWAGASVVGPFQSGNEVAGPGGRDLPDFKAHLRQNVCCGDNGWAWGMASEPPPPPAHMEDSRRVAPPWCPR